MRKILTIVAAATLALAASASGAFAAPNGYGVADDTNLYRIDLATGVATLVGSTGSGSISGLTFSPDGTLYGVNTFTNTAVLVTINTTNGAVTTVGSTGVVDASTGIPTGLTFTNDGRLLMAHQSNIYELNTTTGLGTLIGASGIGVLDSLATDCAGTVYSLNSGGAPVATRLVTVNTTTGAATVVGSLTPTIPTASFGSGLDFDLATGVLWQIGSDGIAPPGPSDLRTIDVAALTDQAGASVASLTITGLAIGSSCATPAEPITATLTFTG